MARASEPEFVCAPSASATMKDFTHPTWVKIACWAAPRTPWFLPALAYALWRAWFPKAGVHRLCRTARSDPTVAEVVEESYTALL
jgi:hypothetical protein